MHIEIHQHTINGQEMKKDPPKAIIPYRYPLDHSDSYAIVAFITQSGEEKALIYGMHQKDHIIYGGKRYDGVKGLYSLYNDIQRDNLAKTLENIENEL